MSSLGLNTATVPENSWFFLICYTQLFKVTTWITYWKEDAQHALVVVGYDETNFYLNDPAFADAPKTVSIDEVMLAWLEFDYMYATVER